MYPHVGKRTLAEYPAIADAVQRNTPCQDQVLFAGFPVHVTCHAQHDFFRDFLQRAGKVHFTLCKRRFRLAWRAAKQLGEFRTGHRQPCAVVEILHVHLERPVFLQVDEVLIDRFDVLRLTVRRKTHHFVFRRVDLEAGKVGERGIQQTG